MEGVSKKRKMSCNMNGLAVHVGGDQEDEEKKVEQFFALIRTLKEARAQLKDNSASAELTLDKQNVNQQNNHKDQYKKHKSDHHHQDDDQRETRPLSVWNPSFLREDFAGDDVELILREKADPTTTRTVVVASDSSNSKSTRASQQEELEEGLDLKLSL